MARVYTEATGFVQTLRNFLARMDRLDEMDRQISVTMDAAQRVLRQMERGTLRKIQLDFWQVVSQEHYSVTGELFNDLQAVLNKHINWPPGLIEPL